MRCAVFRYPEFKILPLNNGKQLNHCFDYLAEVSDLQPRNPELSRAWPYIVYKSEPYGFFEYWLTPEELAARKFGDCEDINNMARTLYLNAGGKWARVVPLYLPGYIHAVLKTDQGFYDACPAKGMKIDEPYAELIDKLFIRH